MEKVTKCYTNHPVLSMWILNSSFKLLSILLQWLSKYFRPACNQLAFAGFFSISKQFPQIFTCHGPVLFLGLCLLKHPPI